MAIRTRTRKRNRWVWSRILLFISWFISRSLLYILILISLATVLIAGRFWLQQAANPPVPNFVTAADLKEKLDSYEKRADELERLLTLLLGVSTIYAVALGVSAYQQLQNAKAEIEQHKKYAEEEYQGFVLKVESKFPLLADMDYAIREIMDRMMYLLPVIDWSDDRYRKLNDQEKQAILFYERIVGSLECFNLRGIPQIRHIVSELYHGLGNFYGQRYAAKNKESKESHAKLEEAMKQIHKPDIDIPGVVDRLMKLIPSIQRSDEDKERARYYLERAIQYDAENTGALNDRGFFATDLEAKPDYETARKVFTKSLDVDAEQQRARYNLARIEHFEKNYGRSIELLTEALAMKHWQGKLSVRHQASILYNQACAYARQGVIDGGQSQTWYSKAIADLRAMHPPGSNMGLEPELINDFKNDIGADGDLFPLTLKQPWRAEIDRIKGDLP